MHNIATCRLYSQRIEGSTFETPGEVVAWLGALQGQDYTGAKLSIGLRLPGSTDADVEQAIADRAIIRTWVMRGTLHLVAAADVRWMVALVSPSVINGRGFRYRELELDEPTLARANDLLANALRDGKQLTRTELFALLQENGISTQGQRGIHMLQHASLHGLICQTVMRKNDPTFIALDDTIPHSKPLARDEALAELARRYFTSRSPATLQDFAWWSGLPMAEARAGLEAVKSQFIEEKIDGSTYWLSDSAPVTQHAPSLLHLLPGFDEFLLSYRDRSASLDPQYAQRVVPANNGVFYPTIVSEGRIVGVWKRTLKKGRVMVEAAPFTSLNAAEQDAFAAEALRYGEFLGLPVMLV